MTAKPRIAIGIPTFNRKSLLELSAASISAATLPADCKLIVIDDISTEYAPEWLAGLYPAHAEIRVREHHSGGADYATPDLLTALYKTGADILILLDSDLLVRKDFIETALRSLDASDGVVSLFNTSNHPAHAERGDFLIKRTVGIAGTVWKREIMAQILKDVPPGLCWGWRVCDLIASRGIEIHVLKQSAAQHIGYLEGENSNRTAGDLGNGFRDADPFNAYLIGEFLLHEIRRQVTQKHREQELTWQRLRQRERIELALVTIMLVTAITWFQFHWL